jgi:hypothetical protein
VRATISRASFNRLDIHLLLLEWRCFSVADHILSRADLYQSRIIEPNVAVSANRRAETISPVTIALLLMPRVFEQPEDRVNELHGIFPDSLRVICGHRRADQGCLLYSQKQTWPSSASMSAKCQ